MQNNNIYFSNSTIKRNYYNASFLKYKNAATKNLFDELSKTLLKRIEDHPIDRKNYVVSRDSTILMLRIDKNYLDAFFNEVVDCDVYNYTTDKNMRQIIKQSYEDSATNAKYLFDFLKESLMFLSRLKDVVNNLSKKSNFTFGNDFISSLKIEIVRRDFFEALKEADGSQEAADKIEEFLNEMNAVYTKCGDKLTDIEVYIDKQVRLSNPSTSELLQQIKDLKKIYPKDTEKEAYVFTTTKYSDLLGFLMQINYTQMNLLQDIEKRFQVLIDIDFETKITSINESLEKELKFIQTGYLYKSIRNDFISDDFAQKINNTTFYHLHKPPPSN